MHRQVVVTYRQGYGQDLCIERVQPRRNLLLLLLLLNLLWLLLL
jgi:hypothetical protein